VPPLIDSICASRGVAPRELFPEKIEKGGRGHLKNGALHV
jgi:hypothetical protein